MIPQAPAVRKQSAAERPRLKRILSQLARLYPEPGCALLYSNPLELLVATVLSAQCTDARVNQVTRDLFHKYRTAADYAGAPPGRLEEDIRSTGFFRNKARSIRRLCDALSREHGGEVPGTMEELVRLPGVGRKTANVVLGEVFGVPGVVVDTHVSRLSRRLGLTTSTDPERIEQDLMKIVPRDQWSSFSMRLILHGRAVCKARVPDCHGCHLLQSCPTGVARV